MESKKVNLEKGVIEIYDFGDMKLHAYQTKDLMEDECFVLENDTDILLIEFPAFRSNLGEFEKYVKGLQKKIVGKVFSDHPNGGGSILTGVPTFASEGTIKSMTEGTIRHLNDGFIPTFGEDFDEKLPEITNVLTENKVTIGSFVLNITYHEENIEIEFPQIHVMYTHMLGHDCHSIVAGIEHAGAMLEQFNQYIERGYKLVLSSHHTPETIQDVKIKIAYLEDLKELAKTSKNAEEFKEKVRQRYPNYSGLNYLAMTAGYFFR